MSSADTDLDETTGAIATRAGLAFTLAAATLFFYDFGCATLKNEGNFDALGNFPRMLPQLLVAIPAGLGLLVLGASRVRLLLRELPGPTRLWTFVGDLIPAAIPLSLVPPLFSGAAISASAWRWPLMLGAMAAVFLAVWLLVRITHRATRRIARSDRARRPVLVLLALVSTGAGVAALHQATVRVLPGLYPELHLGLTLAALALLASFFHVLLASLAIRPSSRLTAIALAVALALASPTGLLLTREYPLSNQLLLEHAPFSPTYLGSVFRAEQAVLSLFRSDDALRSVSPWASSPPLHRARFAAGSPRRSVLLITVDSMRGDTLEPGSDLARGTPGLRELSAGAVSYSRAYAPASHTTRSIPSILAGRFVQEPSALPLEDLIPRPFAQGGYRTECFFTAHDLPVAATRLRHLISAGFAFELHHYRRAGADTILPLVRDALTRDREPVFVWVHLIDLHNVFYEKTTRPVGSDKISYEDQLSRLDLVLSRFVEQSAADRPDLIWALTADHGDARGEHGVYHHGGVPYDEQVRVPLIIGGGGARPAEIAEPVTVLDLPATLLRLAGAEVDERAYLIPLEARDRTRARDSVLITGASACAIVDWPWKLIADPARGSLELFDLEVDPDEKSNTVMTEQRRAFELLEAIRHGGCPADLSVFVGI